MSQAGSTSSQISPIIPPEVATSYVTDNGTAVPSANILEITAIDVTDNNQNGIKTEGGLVETGSGRRVQVQLTNRISGTGTTTDAITQVDLVSFNMGATPGTYLFEQHILAYNVTSGLSATYATFRTVRTTGAAAVIVSQNPGSVSEENGLVNMEDTAVTSDVTTTANTYRVYVTGIAGQTINWLVLTKYEFIGA